MAIFGWLKKLRTQREHGEKVAHQPPCVPFTWPRGCQLTALDETIIAVPGAILADEERIGVVIHADDDVKLSIQDDADAPIKLWLRTGNSVWLTKSCDAVIVPQFEGDTRARRFRLKKIEDST